MQLSVSSNKMKHLHNSTFGSLDNLTFLDLLLNPLESVESGTFAGLTSRKQIGIHLSVPPGIPKEFRQPR